MCLIKNVWDCDFDHKYITAIMCMTNDLFSQLEPTKKGITTGTFLMFDTMNLMGGEL